MKELNASLRSEFSEYSIYYKGSYIYANMYTSSDGNFPGMETEIRIKSKITDLLSELSLTSIEDLFYAAEKFDKQEWRELFTLLRKWKDSSYTS